ncbi:MAG: hypothetical protein ACUVUT_05835 [Candidatus Bipolaricaulia bacterium]
MGLTLQEKQAVTKQLALDYKRATKKEKGKILDGLVRLSGYNRSDAARVLRQRAKPKLLGRLKEGEVTITLLTSLSRGQKPGILAFSTALLSNFPTSSSASLYPTPRLSRFRGGESRGHTQAEH